MAKARNRSNPRQRVVYSSDGEQAAALISGTLDRANLAIRKTGRPDIYSEELGNRICEAMAEGYSLRSVLKRDGMPAMTTVLKWLGDPTKPRFLMQYARARQAQADAIFDECLDIADFSADDVVQVERNGRLVIEANPAAIQRARLRIDTRKWIAGKLRPDKYGDKVLLAGADGGDLTVRNQHVIDVAGMPKEQRDMLRQIMREARDRASEMIDVTPGRRDDGN